MGSCADRRLQIGELLFQHFDDGGVSSLAFLLIIVCQLFFQPAAFLQVPLAKLCTLFVAELQP